MGSRILGSKLSPEVIDMYPFDFCQKKIIWERKQEIDYHLKLDAIILKICGKQTRNGWVQSLKKTSKVFDNFDFWLDFYQIKFTTAVTNTIIFKSKFVLRNVICLKRYVLTNRFERHFYYFLWFTLRSRVTSGPTFSRKKNSVAQKT